LSQELLFSIIIPLEFHRGQAERCVQAWAKEQTLSRDQYEVLLIAPNDFPRREIETLKAMLAPHDRLWFSHEEHDMALCDEGARAARSANFFFTEAHCWPEPDVLAKAAEALRTRPDWAGFSCHSERVTHNRLSVVEADMYEADIKHGMTKHPWRKILDQCFVVRREPYFKAGGFDASLGHFAEWLLAARLHLLGLSIGYLPEAKIHHYYIGRLETWREFAEDFARGEMRYLSGSEADPCAHLFEPIPEWVLRGNWDRAMARGMLAIVWQEWLQLKHRRAEGAEERKEAWRLLRRWLAVVLGGRTLEQLQLTWSAMRARRRIARLMRRAPLKELRLAAVGYNDTVARAERLRCLSEVLDESPKEASSVRGRWEPGGPQTVRTAGLYPPQVWHQKTCCWSEPATLLQLPLAPGDHEICLQWLPVRPDFHPALPRFYWNGRRVEPEHLDEPACFAWFRVSVGGDGKAQLGWFCRSFSFAKDPRAVGLMLHRVTWRPVASQELLPQQSRALFVLHIRKTAGTSLRGLLANRFPVGASLFQAHAREHTKADVNRYSFVTGHVNYGYLSRFRQRPVVMTVLREPLDRAMSAFYFYRDNDAEFMSVLRQELSDEEFAVRERLSQLAGRMSFRELLQQEPELAKSHLGNYMTRMLLSSPAPGDLGPEHLEEAKNHLAACDVVGLVERLNDTLDLLKHQFGWADLGPIDHDNPTRGRRSLADEDPEVLGMLKEWNQLDVQLYAFARDLFERRLAQLRGPHHGANGSTTMRLPDAAHFTFDQPINGYGWHAREVDGKDCICWMGVKDHAWVDLHLVKPVRSELACRIPYAISAQALAGVQVAVNDQPIPMERVADNGGFLLKGEVSPDILLQADPRVRIGFQVAERGRASDLTPGSQDRRTLSVALSNIRLLPMDRNGAHS